MPIEFNIPYARLWLLLILLLAAGTAAWLYFQRRRSATDLPYKIALLLASLRFLSFTTIAFFLLLPMIPLQAEKGQQKTFLLALDNSASMKSQADSLQRILTIVRKLLPPDVAVDTLLFGERVGTEDSLTFSHSFTNGGALLNYIKKRYTSTALLGSLVLSDGIFNRGVPPHHTSYSLPFPVFTYCIGDTTPQKDLWVEKLSYPSELFARTKFPLSVQIRGRGLHGKKSKITITNRQGETLIQKNIILTGNMHYISHTFSIPATEESIQTYQVTLSPAEGESNLQNNKQNAAIRFHKEQKKVLILHSGLHPDYGVWKRILEQTQEYQVTIQQIDRFRGTPETYNLILIGQLPNKQGTGEDRLKYLVNSTLPLLFLIGNNTSPDRWKTLLPNYRIEANKKQKEEAIPILNTDFALFDLSPQTKASITSWGPLETFFGTYHLPPTAQVLLFQNIRQVATRKPLLFIHEEEKNRKRAFLMGEGIWKWRLQEYVRNKEFRAFDLLFHGLIRYMATSKQLSHIQDHLHSRYDETENITTPILLHNKSMERTTTWEMTAELRSHKGKKYTFRPDTSNGAYHWRMGKLPPDNYSYSILAQKGNERYQKRGSFIVREIDIEQRNQVADADALRLMAKKYGGELLTYQTLNSLMEKVMQQMGTMKTQRKTATLSTDLINLWWLLFLPIFLLFLEWIIRKWHGEP